MVNGMIKPFAFTQKVGKVSVTESGPYGPQALGLRPQRNQERSQVGSEKVKQKSRGMCGDHH